jgi:hypothetical protein
MTKKKPDTETTESAAPTDAEAIAVLNEPAVVYGTGVQISRAEDGGIVIEAENPAFSAPWGTGNAPPRFVTLATLSAVDYAATVAAFPPSV